MHPRKIPNNFFQSPFFVILLSTTIGLLAPLLTINGQTGIHLLQRDPTPSLAKLEIWLATVGVQAFAWTIIAAWMFPYLSELMRLQSRRVIWRCLFSTLFLLMPLLIASLWAHRAGIPPAAIAEVPIRPYFGILGAAYDAFIVFLLFLSYEAAMVDAGLDQPALLRAVRFAEKVSLVQQFFIAASLILGLGVVGTAAQQAAIRSDAKLQYPPEYVALFGLMGSLVLLAAYAPVRLGLYRKSQLIIDDVSGEAPTETGNLKTWLDTRASLENLMGHNMASIFGLGGALPLLLPFVLGSAAKLIAK
jgi:hypothetical protein